MAERRVSVRLAAVGGDRLKADLVAIGREGKAALAAIAGGSAPASHGLAETGAAARTLVTRLEAVSARAGAGQVLVNDVVVESAKPPHIAFKELGAVELKGIPRPLQIFEALRASA